MAIESSLCYHLTVIIETAFHGFRGGKKLSTQERYSHDELRKANKKFSRVRSTIESAFYGNNVHEVTSVAEAYNLAKKQSGVI